MTTEPSPLPWRVAESVCGWQNCIEDANGNDIGSFWYNRDRLRAEADAALIVAAVNERDRLRDIVRNAVETLNQVYKHADMTDALREVVAEGQRECRAAIGEDKP